MNKERLKEIKNSFLEGQHILFGTSWVSMPKESFDWLIEQAERVEELELELNDWRAEVQKWQQFYKESEESHLETKELNKRYREALKNIYELAEYDEYDNTLEQIVSEIEKALEELK